MITIKIKKEMKCGKLLKLGKEALKKSNIKLAIISMFLMIGQVHAEVQTIDENLVSINSINSKVQTYEIATPKETAVNVVEINDFWNRNITYKREAPGQDVWQTPEETWRLKTGDCEDIAIAKYFDLIASGASKEDLTLAWVGIKDTNSKNIKYESHIVVLYKKQGVDYVLDNYSRDIIPLNQRSDLIVAGKLNHDLKASEFYQGTGKHLKEVWGGILKNYNFHIATIQNMKGLPNDYSTFLADSTHATKVKTIKQSNNAILAIRNKFLDDKHTSYNKLPKN